MLQRDHLVVVAPSLTEGVAHVRDCLGIETIGGGAHPQMATHNHLLRLGTAYLEVIAADPTARPVAVARWFGLDDVATVRADWAAGRRLRAWVARGDQLEALAARHGSLLGRPILVSRGDREWTILVRPDGSLPLQGAAPPVIDWGARGSPVPDMPDFGLKLASFEVEHPDPASITRLYRELQLVDAPAVRPGKRLRYRATIMTRGGVRTLT